MLENNEFMEGAKTENTSEKNDAFSEFEKKENELDEKDASPFAELSPEQEAAFAEFDKMQAEIEGKPDLEELQSTFSEENWENLTEGQKLDAMMDLRDHIQEDLGMESDLNVRFIPGEGDYAEKTEAEGVQITIDTEHLDNPQDAVAAMAHESYHAYQHEAVDDVSYDDLEGQEKQWKEDFETQEGKSPDDPEVYYSSVETDARTYASSVVSDIFG